ncbi:MAG: ABC transporter permease [Acidobacteria bacterium]|nr:ABC transporter permease [Acidobacteriota bacterium]MYH30892.1 ABC transporter permease [Acidobacteriota bacterium]
MSRLRDAAVRLVNLFRRERIERELDAELQAYLELDVEENIRRGMAPKEARRMALARLGGAETVKEECRDVFTFRHVEDLLKDLRYGVRMVLKHPGFSATAIVVLALGIGANTAIFSIINAMLLKPLPIHRPGELVGVYVERTTAPGGYRPFSYPNFEDLREQAGAFANLAAHNLVLVGIGDGEATRRVWADAVTANYFETFGVPLALGRAFTAAEEQPGANLPVAIVSHDYWVREGRPDVLGETILVNAEPLTIVGVAAAGFTGSSVLFRPEVWLPLGLYGTVATDIAGTPSRSLRERDNYTLTVKGRLGPGHSVESVAPELEAIAARLSGAYPATNADRTLRAAPLPRLDVPTRPATDGQFAALSALVLGMAGVVLLIACLNLANMLLARGASRRREMAIRLSLGGGRGRVVRQLLTEGFVLSVGGGAVGLVVAVWAAGALARSIESVLPFAVAVSGIGVDWRVLLGTLGFCLLGTLFFGLGPAWQMTRGDIVGDLKQRSNPEPRRGRGLPAARDLLIVGQVALSLALLTAGGLFLRGAVAASSADPGFAFERGLLLETDPSLAGYDEVQGRTVYRDLLPRLRALPGVDAVSMASMVPFGSFSEGRMAVPVGAGDQGERAASFTLVADDYFRALGLSMLRGREFTRAETEGGSGSPAVIVDETLARALWPNADPLGQAVRLRQRNGKLGDVLTVVGVAPGRRSRIFDQQPTPHVYLPAGAEYRANMNLHVRLAEPGRAAATAMLQQVRQAVRGFDARLPVLSLQTLEDFRAASAGLWAVQAGAAVFSTFGGLALFLAVVGLYGVKSYVVSQRTREIGLRMALGAQRAGVLWLVLRQGLVMTGAGLLFGALLSVATARLLSGLLYEVRTFDPLVFALAPTLLAGSVLLASWLPARRAARVSPMEALRQE